MTTKDLLINRLRRDLADCSTVLDLGCGPSSLLRHINTIKYSVGVEYWSPSIETSRRSEIHNHYIQGDICDVKFDTDSFDAVILFDVIEHIEQLEAYRVLQRAKVWARKKVIIVVPNGRCEQDTDIDGNLKQQHLSEWSPEILSSFGFEVSGFNGWKPLRGEHGNIIPTKTRAIHYLLSGLSEVTDPIVRYCPNRAYHLYAVWENQRASE
jgi:SAM-dependent methyltransferase